MASSLQAQTSPATQPAAQAQTDVPVKIVVLYSSGVGYFEHFGTVKDQASTELRFKTQQINDILKSLVLQDLDKGTITTITYPSQDPIAKMLKSFQVDITANPSLADLLNQLRGAKVTVESQGQKLAGTILGVEKRQKPVGDKNQVEVAVLNIVSGGMIRSVELPDITRLELEDPQLQQELAKALEALSQARDQDKKPVTINFSGQGERRVKIGYVVETPIWKTSYRLILPAADEKPKLQGWAIIENQTDNDWNSVQLSLVSGRPISFIQDLYRPLYVPRPVVQPELYASLRPQTYEGGMARDRLAESGEFKQELQQAMAQPAAPPAGPQRQLKSLSRAERAPGAGGAGGYPGLAAEELIDRPIDASASIASVASASKMGELFQYTVGSVSLPRQRSAMIPIITDDVEVERLSIYNQSILPKNPLNGARVKNTTGKHLLQGPITVLDANAYAGDARIDNVPPGQERLISYGIDLQLLINATANTTTSAIQTGKIVKGVLYLTRKNVMSQDYLADNKADKDKTLIIEHPVHEGWKLVDTDKPIETTEQLYRFKGAVPAGKATKLTVKEQIIQSEEIAILPAEIGTLDFYSGTDGIPAQVKLALAKAVSLKQALADTQRQINENQQEVNRIRQEQTPIRENMKTVAQNSDYYQRLLKKLDEQETKIDQSQAKTEDLKKKLDQQRKELDDYVNALEV